MSQLLREVFSFVCAQNVAHTWAPGGEMLPMCQRCTGLYAGAALALGLLMLFRPRPGPCFRWIHVALVLAMTPFGFHLVEHGAVLRTASGSWFGFGVAGLLWLLPSRSLAGKGDRPGSALHFILGLTGILMLPVFAARGGAAASAALPWIGFAGLIALAGLVLANIGTLLSGLKVPPRAARNR